MMQRVNKYIAFVCSGNTCRSPMAEGIFNMLAEEKQLDVRAESFGVATASGMKASAGSVIVCKELGVDLSEKTSVSAVDTDLDKYDKFFCMSKNHLDMLSHYFNISPDKIIVMNVSDPYGGSTEIYRECRDKIYNSVKEIIKDYEN